MLRSETKRIIRKIREAYKDPLTKKPMFKTDDDVIEYAVESLWKSLSQVRR